MKRAKKLPQPESVADFRQRIAAIMRGLNPEAIVGAPHADPCVVRKPTSRGYNPPKRKDTR